MSVPFYFFLGRTFILSSSDNDYRINCCGYVSSWEFYVGDSTGTLFAQVWRPSGTDWQLVNQTAIISNPYVITSYAVEHNFHVLTM